MTPYHAFVSENGDLTLGTPKPHGVTFSSLVSDDLIEPRAIISRALFVVAATAHGANHNQLGIIRHGWRLDDIALGNVAEYCGIVIDDEAGRHGGRYLASFRHGTGVGVGPTRLSALVKLYRASRSIGRHNGGTHVGRPRGQAVERVASSDRSQ